MTKDSDRVELEKLARRWFALNNAQDLEALRSLCEILFRSGRWGTRTLDLSRVKAAL
jgi:hypothetical protein